MRLRSTFCLGLLSLGLLALPPAGGCSEATSAPAPAERAILSPEVKVVIMVPAIRPAMGSAMELVFHAREASGARVPIGEMTTLVEELNVEVLSSTFCRTATALEGVANDDSLVPVKKILVKRTSDNTEVLVIERNAQGTAVWTGTPSVCYAEPNQYIDYIPRGFTTWAAGYVLRAVKFDDTTIDIKSARITY